MSVATKNLRPETSADLTGRFGRSVALIIGIDRYGHGIEPLQTAVADARAIAATLQRDHGYEVFLLLDEAATLEGLRNQLQELARSLDVTDRLLVYFAGHGVAITDDDEPQGFVLPYAATPGYAEGYLAMNELHDSLAALPCRHLLLILDCCFAGSFRWTSLKRDIMLLPSAMYWERYERFSSDPAWQVITSAGPDQRAFDTLSLRDHRGQEGQHSPFAAVLLQALAGAADTPPTDGLITATELYIFLRNTVEPHSLNRARQTPGLWPLRKHDKGEFLFQVPNHPVVLTSAPPLTLSNNPYRGLEPFTEQRHFHGRGPLIAQLLDQVLRDRVVLLLGASGSGKSSLVRAGLLPAIEQAAAELRVLGPLRPTANPLTTWLHIDEVLTREDAQGQHLIVVDQLEELFSLCLDDWQRREFMKRLLASGQRILLVLRSDFEPQLSANALINRGDISRMEMTPLRQDELREIIERPAAEQVLYFEPPSLIDRLINDVEQMPGALPLLSFTLSELYRLRLQRPTERTLTQADYEDIGGVAGALTRRASAECDALIQEDAKAERTARNILLRMVAATGQLARRRVTLTELEFGDAAEDGRVWKLLKRLREARLLTNDQEAGQSCIEPAHDALVSGWERLVRWRSETVDLPLQRLLWAAAYEWDRRHRATGDLWDRSDRLEFLRKEMEQDGTWLNRMEAQFVHASLRRLRRTTLTRWALVIGTFVALLGLSLVALRQRDDAREQQQRALTEARVALSRQLAAQAMREHSPDLAALLAIQGLITDDQLEPRSALRAVIEEAPLRAAVLHGKAKPVESLAISPDGTLLAVCSEADGIFDIFDLKSYRLLSSNSLPSYEPLRSAAFSPDQHMLALGRSGGIVLWDMVNGRVLRELTGHPGSVIGMRFKARGAQLLAADWSDGLFTWDLGSRRPLSLRQIRRQSLLEGSTHTDMSASGHYVLQGRENQLTMWRIEQNIGDPIPLPSNSDSILSVAIDSQGKLGASGHFGGEVLLWDLERSRLRSRDRQSTQGVQSLAFSPDGSLLSAGRQDGSISLYETARTDGPLDDWRAHKKTVTSLIFSPDGQRLVSGATDGSVVVWDLRWRRPFGLPNERHTKEKRIGSLSVSRDARRIVTSSLDGSVRLWDIESKRLLGRPYRPHPGSILGLGVIPVLSTDISPDGRWLASGGQDGGIVLIDTTTDEPRTLTPKHREAVETVAFDPAGKILASVGWEGEIALWDLATGKRRGEPLKGHHHPMSDSIKLDFSPDGRLLASGSSDETVLLWDVETGKPVGSPLRHEAIVSAVRFSRDGRMLAVGSNQQVFLWNLPSRTLRPLPLRGHTQSVAHLSFAPDGKVLVSSDLRDVRIWDLDSGQLAGPPLDASLAEVSWDGRLLVVAEREELRVHELSIAAFSRQGCELANRNLSLAEWTQYVGKGAYCRTCAAHEPGAGAPAYAPSCKAVPTAGTGP